MNIGNTKLLFLAKKNRFIFLTNHPKECRAKRGDWR